MSAGISVLFLGFVVEWMCGCCCCCRLVDALGRGHSDSLNTTCGVVWR